MRKEILLPGVAVVGGAVGFALRRWELATAFEPDTGLAIAGMPSTWALILFTLVMVAALAVLCRDKDTRFSSYDQAFAAKGNTLYMIVMVVAAFLMAIGGVVELMAVPEAYQQAVMHAQQQGGQPSMLTIVPRAALALLSIASGWCVLMIGRNNYRGEGHGKYNAALLTPAYTACVWLIVSYQARSGDPVVLDYAWQLFAVIGAVLGCYFMAGFSFERAKPYRAEFTMLAGVYFILVTFADKHSLSMLLLYGAYFLYLLASSTALLFNASHSVGRKLTKDLEEPHDGE